MYETEPRYNDPRYNSIPDITGIKKKEKKKKRKRKKNWLIIPKRLSTKSINYTETKQRYPKQQSLPRYISFEETTHFY